MIDASSMGSTNQFHSVRGHPNAGEYQPLLYQGHPNVVPFHPDSYPDSQPMSPVYASHSGSRAESVRSYTPPHSRGNLAPVHQSPSGQEVRFVMHFSDKQNFVRIANDHGVDLERSDKWNMAMTAVDGRIIDQHTNPENNPNLWPITFVFTSKDAVPMAYTGIDTTGDGRIDTYVHGIDRNRDGIPDVLQQQAAPSLVHASTVLPWGDKAHYTQHPHDMGLPTLLPRGASNSEYHMIGNTLRDPDYMHGMEGARRLLLLLQEAFSTSIPAADLEPIKPKKKLFGVSILDDIYHHCGFGGKSPAEMEKSGLDSELRRLYKSKAACAELMDEIEKKVLDIERVIEDRRHRKQRVLASIGHSQGFLNCCNNCCDDEVEDIPHARGMAAGQVELRCHLRERLEETALSLSEKEKELRELKQGRGQYLAGAAALDPASVSMQEIRQRIIANTIAKFAKNAKEERNIIFYTWKNLIATRKAQDKFRKFGAKGFVSSPKEMMMLCFNSWRADWQEAHAKKHSRQDFTKAKYAAKFFDSSSLKFFFVEWHKVTKDSLADRRLEAAQRRFYKDAEDAMEARFANLTRMHAGDQKVSVKVWLTEGRGLDVKERSLYCVCEIPEKPPSKIRTETVKSQKPQHYGQKGCDVKWNYSAVVPEYAATDSLTLKVYIDQGSGVMGHIAHMMHDDTMLGSVVLRASQFYPDGFQGWLELTMPASNKKVNIHDLPPVPEINVKVVVTVEQKNPVREFSPRDPLSDALQKANEALARAEAAERAAQEGTCCLPICRSGRNTPRHPPKSPPGRSR